MLRSPRLLERLLIAIVFATGSAGAQQPVPSHRQSTGPLEELGIPVSTGAAPGYVPDSVCTLCHTQIANSYQSIAMSRAFYRPSGAPRIEDFSALPLHHELSKRWFSLAWEGDQLNFRRWQVAPDGQQTNIFQTPVEWVLGSGTHSRNYLYRTPDGHLFQLPLSWYSQTGEWGMAPGYDHPSHEDIHRPVRRECMFCHNAYPEVAAGSDAHWQPHVFPEELPSGLGCQRCHGPGAVHVELASRRDVAPAAIRQSLVDLSALPAQRRDDVCLQCHLQASAALFGVRRFDRGDYSYRPGEALEEYLVHVDPLAADQQRSERFEINHHAYRLRQSRCYAESAGALHCLTCHDPHGKPPAKELSAHYRRACASCHAGDACSRPVADSAAAATRGAAWQALAIDDDCTACHMPARRAQDVIHVVMTDHLIRRDPSQEELLAPLAEHRPEIVGARFLDPKRAPSDALGQIYLSLSWLRAGLEAGGARLVGRLVGQDPASMEPYVDLTKSFLESRRPADALELLERLAEKWSPRPPLDEWKAIALAQTGDQLAAVALLSKIVEERPVEAETHCNLGRLLLDLDRPADAIAQLETATAKRPNFSRAWMLLAIARQRTGQLATARTAAEQALIIEPEVEALYLVLTEVLLELDRPAEAAWHLRHGVAVCPQPELLAGRLAELEAMAAGGPPPGP